MRKIMKYQPLKIGNLTAKIPIIQGGMGVGISLSNLAGAVAKEGAIGVISTAQIGFRSPNYDNAPLEANLKAIPEYLKKAREIAEGGIIGMNIMVATKHYEQYVKAAVEAGVDLIISGAGLPTQLPEYVKGSSTKIAPIVSSKKSASVLLKMWDRKQNRMPDLVVIEGPKAGGHLGFKKEELETIDDETYDKEIFSILEVIKEYEQKYNTKIPVVAAGGIYEKKDMEHYMDMGLDGVQIATRFVTTKECDAPDAYKMAYINCKKEEIEIVKSPVGMPGRAIHNEFQEKYKTGAYRTKKCHQCIITCNPAETPYCITDALVNAAKGKIEEALLFCGAYAYKAKKIETVKEVIDSLIE